MEEQSVMNEAIAMAVAEVTRVVIQTIMETQTQRSEGQQGPKLGSPVLKQPCFNWEAADKYTEWKAFILKVRNVLSTYNAQEQEKIAIVKNWLGRNGWHYLESLTKGEKQAWEPSKDCWTHWPQSLDPSLMRKLNHVSLGNCADSRVKVQRNGWGDYE